jgi:hypothetical protein
MPRFFPNSPVRRRLLKVLIAVAAMPLLAVGSCAALIKTAEWRAHSFCDGIPLGSDIGPAIRRFEGTTGKPDARHYSESNGAGHSFVFPFSIEDRAYCDVSLDPGGHVVAKHTYTLYD